MKALRTGSLAQVRLVLKQDPEAANDMFCDHKFETPLSFAIRTGCSPLIVKLLLEHGACIDACDIEGRTLLAVLSTPVVDVALLDPQNTVDLPDDLLTLSSIAQMKTADEQRRIKIAMHLLAVGANPSIPDRSGIKPKDIALNTNQVQLAFLLEYYLEAQACIVLLRMARCTDSSIGEDLVQMICQCLVPSQVCKCLWS